MGSSVLRAPLQPGQQLTGALPLAITPSTPVNGSSRSAEFSPSTGQHGGALDRLAISKGKQAPALRRLIVPKSDIVAQRRELAVAGISESLIFPELSGLCRELKRSFFGV